MAICEQYPSVLAASDDRGRASEVGPSAKASVTMARNRLPQGPNARAATEVQPNALRLKERSQLKKRVDKAMSQEHAGPSKVKSSRYHLDKLPLHGRCDMPSCKPLKPNYVNLLRVSRAGVLSNPSEH